ncbi:hypothetical protein RFI_07837 [Reticulomyxa filosa]|uniref:Uncharacterized protein n=1 Tax=Reticulomyxa filosa TaxID=46433 RepID=X6NTG8_RETFI|nr:hypothetical protein RFI_07837 [Reticulomyxa filosa]|eukprot:ETO29286.1 hypothetical protein RFI_07837 [Reticulomyxa filosa]
MFAVMKKALLSSCTTFRGPLLLNMSRIVAVSRYLVQPRYNFTTETSGKESSNENNEQFKQEKSDQPDYTSAAIKKDEQSNKAMNSDNTESRYNQQTKHDKKRVGKKQLFISKKKKKTTRTLTKNTLKLEKIKMGRKDRKQLIIFNGRFKNEMEAMKFIWSITNSFDRISGEIQQIRVTSQGLAFVYCTDEQTASMLFYLYEMHCLVASN